uniref:RING-type domain-containing protein n=1 Tax=Musa acuminata subsp. malaccensis TaxID=214687 RepID=A0A804HTN4_MUSAM|nr:PREDICTED: E3 ubiquitin-protein ligase TRAIP-like isoform X3 [Musa acuminata subsp. malaccensis]
MAEEEEGDGRTTGSKPICTICYEDLKPLVEHLQAAPICGHVFHELCLQQWFEYCPAGKKPICPVCNQSCPLRRPTRLYFQSAGDSAAATQTTITSFVSQRPSSEALAAEVGRLELKLASLTAKFEIQETHLKELNDEVSSWKESATREEAKRLAIKKEKERIEQFLHAKTEELNRKSLECLRLEERNLGLGKELAALKLATDLNLGEEEMVKLASLGHGCNHDNAIDVMKRSLALRNKSYKELMAQCNNLGRAETRSRQNLDKAIEKIRKMKMRIQELEKALEDKENGFLRDLKASKKRKAKGISGGLQAHNDLASPADKDKNFAMDLNDDASFFDVDALKHRPSLHEDLYRQSDTGNQSELYKSADIQKRSSCEQDASSCPNREAYSICKPSDASGKSWIPDISKHRTENTDEHGGRSQIDSTWVKEVLSIDNITKKKPSAENITETQACNAAAIHGDGCFPGVLGTSIVNKNVGRWCKQDLKKPSSSLGMEASKSSGDLIAVGADGRGGRIKILRSGGHSLSMQPQSPSSKKSKYEANRTSQLQIERFFRKPKTHEG